MPLPVYDTQDAVPQDQREDYAEHDGKWHHKVEIEVAVEKKKRATLLNEKRESDRKAAEAEQKLADAERAAEAARKGISAEELQKIRDAEALARRPIETERDTLKAENRKLKLTDRVQALYLDPKVGNGMQDRLEDAMEALAKRTDLDDKGGIVFKDKDGNVTTDDAAAFFAKHKKEKPWFYAGSGASGSSASGSNGAGGGTRTDEPAAETTDRHRNTVAGAL